jgi:hypothetical protein
MDCIAVYWLESGSRVATSTAAGSVRSRLGVHPSMLLEHSQNNIPEIYTDHNPQTVEDWLEWGTGIVLGLRDYYWPLTIRDQRKMRLSRWPMLEMAFAYSPDM